SQGSMNKAKEWLNPGVYAALPQLFGHAIGAGRPVFPANALHPAFAGACERQGNHQRPVAGGKTFFRNILFGDGTAYGAEIIIQPGECGLVLAAFARVDDVMRNPEGLVDIAVQVRLYKIFLYLAGKVGKLYLVPAVIIFPATIFVKKLRIILVERGIGTTVGMI